MTGGRLLIRGTRRMVHAFGLVLGLLATAVAASVTVLPPAAAVTPSGAALFGSVTTAYTSNAEPIHGQQFKIVGQVFLVLGDSPTPMPNQTVTLERGDSPSGPWAAVATAETAEATLPNGEKHIMYSFDVTARRTAWFRVRYDGMPDSEAIAPSRSDDGDATPIRVRVHRQMPIRLAQPRAGGVFLVGIARPDYAYQRVAVLRSRCPKKCAWRPYATRLTDARGRYRVELTVPRGRTRFFVARSRASSGFAVSYSQPAKITAG